MGWEAWQSDSEAEARGKKRPSCARIGRLKPAPPRQVTGEKTVGLPGLAPGFAGRVCETLLEGQILRCLAEDGGVGQILVRIHGGTADVRSEEHTSELQSLRHLV